MRRTEARSNRAWRTPDNVRLRHDFMEQRYVAGDTLKQVAVALKEEFGLEPGRTKALDHSSVLHHINGRCKCYPDHTRVRRPDKPLTKHQKMVLLHREIETLAEMGMTKIQIAQTLGVSWDIVRYHRRGMCQCEEG